MNNILKKTLAVALSLVTVVSTGMVANATELTPVEKTENSNGEVVVQATDTTTDYTSVADKVEEALPEVSAEPVLNVNSIEEIDSKDTINDTSDSIFKSCRLIVTNPTDLEFKEESLGVDNIVSVQKYEDKYFVTYRSVYATEKAYNDLTALGLDVEVDVVQDTPEGVDIKDDKGNDIESKDIALTEETRPTKSVKNVVIEDTQKNEKTIVVAVLDTGLNNEEAIFEDKVIEGKNFVSEQSDVKDLDGHGTTMSRIVLDTTEDNVKILPIKVLNDEGKGTTLSAYKGIKYVIEKKKENPSLDFVINLSMSGIGHSKLLEAVINEAYNNNIPVVVSAGNDNKEITEYTPANIESAFTITSADKNEDNITKAPYSNFGNDINKVDYTTNGHYEYTRKIDNREVITKVDGTSVSSAYVSSYIALLKQLALIDEDDNNDNLTTSDVDRILTESTTEISNEAYFGRGYLDKENVSLVKTEKETAAIENNTENLLPVENNYDITEEQKIILEKNGWFVDGSGRLWTDDEGTFRLALGATDIGFFYGSGWNVKDIVICNNNLYLTESAYCHIKQGVNVKTITSDTGSRVLYNNASGYNPLIHCMGNLNANGVVFDGNNHWIPKYGAWGTAGIDVYSGWGFYAENCEFRKTNGSQEGVANIFGNTGSVITINGGSIHNAPDGIYSNGTVTIQGGCNIYSHSVAGVHTDQNSKVTINSSNIYSNSSFGIFVCGNTTINSGNFYSNTIGVVNTLNGTVTIKGGTIRNNSLQGVYNYSEGGKYKPTAYINDGNIYSNLIGVSCESIVEQNGGTIYSNSRSGVEVAGNFTLNTGTIRNNTTGITNNKTVTQSGGSITSNTTGVSNSSDASYTMSAGSISSNTGFGVNNSGTVTQTGGSIYSNKGATPEGANGGVLQNGTYNVGAGADIPNNSVYLKSGKVLNVISNLSTTDAIPLTTDTDDRTVGRVLVTADSTALADANESKFKLAFAQPVNDSDGANFSGKLNSGSVRTGSRMPYVDDSKMVLSGIYKVNYNGKRDDAQSIFSYNPSDNFFYWLEPVNEVGLADTSKVVKVTSWEPYEETDLSATGTGDYEFMGWCEKADGSDTIYKEIRTEWLAKNKPYYAIYRRGKAKVTYNPNGAVDENGNKYGTVTDENSTSIYSDYDLQSGSTFGTLQEEEKYIVVDKKGTNDIVDNAYYKVKKGDIINNLGKKTKMYSFQGWSVVDYADHTAEEILYGGTLPFIDLVSDFNAVLDKGYQTKPNNKTLKSIVNEIKDRSKYYNSGKLVKWNEEFDNNGIVNMYATWDEYPEINTKELVFTERQFNNITEEDLLKKLTATDREDGDITKKVKILNFDDVVKTLNALNTTAATTVTYEVTDSAGNTTRAYAEVWRNSDTPLEISDPEHTAHIRSICRQAYDTHDPKNGGCMKDSLWYNDPEYVQVMLTGFDNMENDVSIMSYTYTKEDRERISAFVDEHGIGNSLEPDGLKKYHAIFGTSEYETQNRMDILIDGNDEDSSITILGFEFKWNDKELNQLRKKKDQARIERLRNKIAQASNPQA